MTDIHAHILHGIDDGPKTLEDSINLIKKIVGIGVETIAATSHFYPMLEPKECYVSKHLLRLSEITKQLDDEEIKVKIVPGAEVLLDEFLLNQSDLSGICYNGGKHILLELPKKNLDYDESVMLIERVMSYYNVVPVIAHAERYKCLVRNIRNVEYLKDMGCLIQLDSDCFFDRFAQRHFGFHLLKNNLADIVGSDCHNTSTRSSNLHLAYGIIAEKMGNDVVDMLKYNANVIVGN